MDTRKEREPIYVPVRKRERREEPLRQIDERVPGEDHQYSVDRQPIANQRPGE